jgi:hypothetical protein
MALIYGAAGNPQDGGADVLVSAASGDLTINLEYDSAAQAAPASFRSSIQTAANLLSAAISDPISVNLGIGYGDVPFFNDPLSNGEAAAGVQNSITEPYSTLRSQLLSNAATPQIAAAINALPAASSLTGVLTAGGAATPVTNFQVAYAEARALGDVPSSNSTVDGDAGFATDIPSNLLVGVALHELTHAMGRVPGTSVLSLFRYISPGVHDFRSDVPTAASYFSIDNGTTDLADFGENSDPSDFLNPPASNLTPNDPFDEFYGPGTIQQLTSFDLLVLGVLGFARSSIAASPSPPVPAEVDAVIQNSTTGQVDYLQYQGSTLVGSNLVDYGLGASYKIVGHGDFNGDGHQDLVAQNPATGAVDFLYLDATAHLVGSAMSSALPRIVGGGNFGSAAGQTGPTLVAQLANGELDMLGLNSAGHLIASDLISNTVGSAPVAGVGEGAANIPSFAGIGSNDNVVLQLADGSLDVIGFSGSLANASLTMSSSFLSRSNPGSGLKVSAINQGVGGNTNQNVSDGSGREGVQMISQLANGSIDALYFDSGYNTTSQGTMYASNLLAGAYPGWNVVDAGSVAHNDLFPIT